MHVFKKHSVVKVHGWMWLPTWRVLQCPSKRTLGDTVHANLKSFIHHRYFRIGWLRRHPWMETIIHLYPPPAQEWAPFPDQQHRSMDTRTRIVRSRGPKSACDGRPDPHKVKVPCCNLWLRPMDDKLRTNNKRGTDIVVAMGRDASSGRIDGERRPSDEKEREIGTVGWWMRTSVAVLAMAGRKLPCGEKR